MSVKLKNILFSNSKSVASQKLLEKLGYRVVSEAKIETVLPTVKVHSIHFSFDIKST